MKDFRDISRRAIYENKLKLAPGEVWNFYQIPIFFFALALGFMVFILFADTHKHVPALFSIPFLLVAIIVFITNERSLRFRSVETNMNPSQQCSYLRWVIEEKLKWRITEINEHLIIAKTPESFENDAFGQRVTIVFDNGRTLLNSIMEPKNYRHGVMPLIWNRHNLNILTEYIGDTQDLD